MHASEYGLRRRCVAKSLIRRPFLIQRFFRIAVYRLKFGSDVIDPLRTGRTGSVENRLAILSDGAFHHQARCPNSDAARSRIGRKRRAGSRCEGHIERCGNCAAHDDRGWQGDVLVREPRAGKYAVQAQAPQLTLGEAIQITLTAGTQTLNLTLKVTSVSEKVTVRGFLSQKCN
jgi:hypothetical protein